MHRKIQARIKQQNRKTRVYYSFLSVVLTLMLVWATISAVYNIIKIVDLKQKIKVSNKIYKAAKAENDTLHYAIDNWDDKSAEAILRNKFKLCAPDETLVIFREDSEYDEEIATGEKDLNGYGYAY